MRRLIFLAALCILGAGSAFADDYPTHPIRLIVPFAPGGAVDPIARLIANPLGERLGKPIVIYDRGGAGGSIGMDEVAKSPPDGYTLLLDHSGMTYMPGLYRTLPFDPVKDFDGIITAVAGFYVLAVSNDLPVKSVAELIAYAKANPGKLSFASGNTAGIVGGDTLANWAGINIIHVPYTSTPPALEDIIAGRVSMMFADFTTAMPHVSAGTLRALALSRIKRSSLYPDLPTMDESGLKGFNLDAWAGLVAPAGTPPDVIAKLNGALRKIIDSPEVQQKFKNVGFEGFSSTPAELGDYIKAQLAEWQKMVKDANIQAD